MRAHCKVRRPERTPITEELQVLPELVSELSSSMQLIIMQIVVKRVSTYREHEFRRLEMPAFESHLDIKIYSSQLVVCLLRSQSELA